MGGDELQSDRNGGPRDEQRGVTLAARRRQRRGQ